MSFAFTPCQAVLGGNCATYAACERIDRRSPLLTSCRASLSQDIPVTTHDTADAEVISTRREEGPGALEALE
jgi:hypothetical protein